MSNTSGHVFIFFWIYDERIITLLFISMHFVCLAVFMQKRSLKHLSCKGTNASSTLEYFDKPLERPLTDVAQTLTSKVNFTTESRSFSHRLKMFQRLGNFQGHHLQDYNWIHE